MLIPVRFSELREQITPEIMEIIKQQRLNYLVEGTRFTKYSKGQRMKGELTKKAYITITLLTTFFFMLIKTLNRIGKRLGAMS